MIHDLTTSSLFTSILEIEQDDQLLDIHNDYNLISVQYIDSHMILTFESSNAINLIIKFSDVKFINFNMFVNDDTINNFYRGRFESQGTLYDEYEGKYCFYIDFELGGQINLLCSKVTLTFN